MVCDIWTEISANQVRTGCITTKKERRNEKNERFKSENPVFIRFKMYLLEPNDI